MWSQTWTLDLRPRKYIIFVCERVKKVWSQTWHLIWDLTMSYLCVRERDTTSCLFQADDEYVHQSWYWVMVIFIFGITTLASPDFEKLTASIWTSWSTFRIQSIVVNLNIKWEMLWKFMFINIISKTEDGSLLINSKVKRGHCNFLKHERCI